MALTKAISKLRTLSLPLRFESNRVSASLGYSAVNNLPRVHCKRQNHTFRVEAPVSYDQGSRLEVQIPRWPQALNFPYVWLRDHCYCERCYNSKTFQKMHDIYDIALNIQPLKVTAGEDELTITWDDGHISTYDYKFLWQNNFEGRQYSQKSKKELWTGTTFPSADQTTVPLGDIVGQGKGLKKLVNSIIKFGVGFISEVPPTVEATQSAIEEVCIVKKTFFGEMWAFTANLEHSDTAYSTEYIGAHTDTTYFRQASRIQAFHCLQPSAEGGETLLVDGFNVANQFQHLHPNGYKFLSSKPIPSEYIEEGRHHLSLDYILKHDPVTQELTQFRYNIHDRAPLSSIPLHGIEDFYAHYHNLTKLVRMEKNEHWVKLEPGTIVLIDNWRVMHGRAAYSGNRIMGGCYLDEDDFASKARILNVL
ncbi:trimethyllysine hydroxylase [Oratosquilla oratoria]|uniref:trimethyllysine hydroxylase n=1 Tax=Oratosquilla oratoria TaxID=337810 RepID=UPI003F76B0F7